MTELRKFFRYFRPYKVTLIVGVLFIFISTLFGLFTPFLVGQAVDDLTQGVTWAKINFYALTILGTNVISGVFLFWQRRLIINMSRYIEYDMRREFYEHIVNQPIDFFQNNRVGDLMARATNDLSAIRQIVGPMILYSFQAVFVVLIALPLLLRTSVLLTILLFVTMPLVSLTVKYFGQQIHVRFEVIQGFFSQISSRAQENLTGVRVIRAYAQETAEIEKFQELNREYAKRNLGLVKFSAAMRPLLQFFIGLGFALIFVVGIPMAVNGTISAGDFTAFNLYLQRMIWPLIAVGYVINLYQRGTASLKRIEAIYAVKPTIFDAPNAREQQPIRGAIEFKNLTFGYNGDGGQTVLRDVNLKIEAGKTVAFVGKTGSGKSTLISLIPRLMDAPENSIFVDGIAVKDYPLQQLRQAIGFVPQETFLFSETLAENIAFGVESGKWKVESEKTALAVNGSNGSNGHGKLEKSTIHNLQSKMANIERAAEIAVLAEDVQNFPDKYETLVGERGITLSGGQKQRTAIARAVVKNPRILILDDSLSAVDTYTEERILNNLREIRNDRTTLIVSHRISTVRDADLICVLDEGAIIERGTHDELLDLRGEYADLYQRQLLEEELAATK
ncbi:MAG: ABC transporter ATP-binding protein [Pyrinomonadaceae bacterium]|nr:ABC transporter ATP-binding protein [Pyrinomonadaceae bacterium]